MRWMLAIAALAAASAQTPAPQQPPLPAVEELRLGAPPTPATKPPAARQPEEPKPVILRYEGKPLRIPYQCTEQDIQTFGMSCSADDPCRIYAELAFAYGVGDRIFVTGNLHNANSTMYSLLLSSQDAGKTWTEPFERIRFAGLEQIQFFDLAHGWIGGQLLLTPPRDPFFLITANGGKNWRRRPVFSDGRVGLLDSFRFDSPHSGTLIFDRSQTGETEARWERYETMTGAESWMIREASSRRLEIRAGRLEPEPLWRLRTDAALQAYLVERRQGQGWSPVASFAVQVGDCRPVEPAAVDAPPESLETISPPAEAVAPAVPVKPPQGKRPPG